MKVVKIGVIVVCLGLAGYFAVKGGADDSEIPDTPESATTWMCKACQHDYSLTALQFDKEERRVSGKKDRGIGPLRCPAQSCGKEEAWRANRCPTHGRMFFIQGVPGEKGLCSECSPPPPPKAVIEQPTETGPKKQNVPLL